MSLYSIKMRASKDGVHVSGGERIAEQTKLKQIVDELLDRPAEFDFMNIKIEKISKVTYIKKSLDIYTYIFKDYIQANKFAAQLISAETGINIDIVERNINLIHTGAAENGNVMRGAMIVDMEGNRREFDKNRGVRTTGVDFVNREDITHQLLGKGFTTRTADAVAIATKNLNSEHILAEYCISDDPEYLFGYVAVKGRYIRLFPLKEKGNPKGGRIYFVKKNTDINQLYEYLEKENILIEGLGEIL